MLKAQRNTGRVVLAVTVLVAFAHVAIRTESATARPPERSETPSPPAPVRPATFHTFDIEEVFSNGDGSVQFVELRETEGINGNFHFGGNQLTTDANAFIYPTDLPGTATAGRFVLLATAEFAALPGAVTPDYIIPASFVEITGDKISIFETATTLLVDTFIFGGSVPVPCSCNGDVNNDGIVNIIDAVVIGDCKNGNCSGCLSSCDVNCDGAVDAKDLADDVVATPSTWLCLFQGVSPEVCCAASGACCDTTTGLCTNDTTELNCTGVDLTWSSGLSCAAVSCTSPPTGACCDLDRGTCQDDVVQLACAGANLVWSQGQTCTAVSCPIPPQGACCNVGNGQCVDVIPEVDCTGVDLVWTVSTSCSTLTCEVPPQIPCPCDGDVNNDGIVNITDALAVEQCKRGDCSGCLSSCDLNCDGVVDTQDLADDVIGAPSTWLCLFQGVSPATCCASASGACCDTTTGNCTEDVFELSCTGTNLNWSPGLTCASVSCPIPPTGACCDAGNGQCLDGAFEVNCMGANLAWSPGLTCAAVSCPVPPTGACCNFADGQCLEGALEVDCTGSALVWTPSTACSAVSCQITAPLPTDGSLSLNRNGTTGVNSPTNFAGETGSVNAAPSIPAMSRASLVVMMLLLLLAAAAITRTRRRDTHAAE